MSIIAFLSDNLSAAVTRPFLSVKGVACETNIAHWLVAQARPTTTEVGLAWRLVACFLIHEPYQKTYFLSHQGTQIVM